MSKIEFIDKTQKGIKKVHEFISIHLNEFVPVVEFDKESYSRPYTTKLTTAPKAVTLSGKIDEELRVSDLVSITTKVGEIALPFLVKRGALMWDNTGVIEARLPEGISGVEIVKNARINIKYGDRFEIRLRTTGFQERVFNVDFYANDDDHDYDLPDYANIHCGRITVSLPGTSKVGARVIANLDALPDAPPGYSPPDHATENPKDVELSQILANKYDNCRGVCYAVTEARAQKAYKDVIGHDVVDLTVSSKNIDHLIAGTVILDNPLSGFGPGGPFIRHGYGEIVSDSDAWTGKLKVGALVQYWRSHDPDLKVRLTSGHSGIFRSYAYNDIGEITGIEFSDYHGDINGPGAKPRKPWSKDQFLNRYTIYAANLLDEKR